MVHVVLKLCKYNHKKIIKEIKADKSKQDIWHGAVYIRKLEDYKDMGISLTETGEMQVTGTIGFFSRTVEWIRTDKVPST